MEATLGQRAYEHIRGKLSRGEFPPGARLVNRTLAKEIGISFTPVREAISRLASEGLVDYVPGAGAYVRNPDRQELAQLYDLRENFEPFAAAEAAKHITSHEVDELQSICDDWHRIAESIGQNKPSHATAAQMRRWLDNEERFHRLLVTAARNRWLTKIVNELQLLARGFAQQRSAPDFMTAGAAQDSCAQHDALLAALKSGDPDDARSLMAAHILAGRKNVLEYFESHRP